MLVFHADDARTQRDVYSAITRVFLDRLRIFDDFGYVAPSRLATVLPATSTASAWTVADEVCLKLPHDLPLPKCEVYAYPGQESGNAHGVGSSHAPSEATVELRARSGGQTCDRGNGSGSYGCRRLRPVAAQRGEADQAPRHEAGAQPLEPLLLRPLPLWKRSVDLAIASVALVAMAPVFLLISIAIKLTSPGPALFRQMRSGLGGKPFPLYKFRSMVHDAEWRKADLMAFNEQDGPAFKIRSDPRVTRLGRYLRKTSLDELPQLWNVLRGDMSLVGPRPLPCNESDACTGWHRRRLEVTPGLTCIWQVEGRSQVSFSDWVRMDIRYIRLRSLIKDMLLMAQTLPAMLLRRGT